MAIAKKPLLLSYKFLLYTSSSSRDVRFSPKFFALSIFREFGLDLGFDSHSRQNSISFNSRELFGQINGELQGENNEDQCTNDEEETVVDGRTGGLMGKPGTRISDPRFIQDMISLFFTIS